MDLEAPVERRQPVGQPAQAGADGRIGAADAVVADLNHRVAAVAVDAHSGVRRAGVFGHVGQGLGHHEVGSRLDRSGQSFGGHLVETNR